MDTDAAQAQAPGRSDAVRHGHVRARRGRTGRCARCTRCVAGAHAGGGLRRRGGAISGAVGARRRARHADLRARCTGARTRSPARSRAAGMREGDGVAIMCRNHRGFVEATVACSKLGASALYLNTAFAGPADRRRARARAPPRGDLRRGVRELVERGRRRAASASSHGQPRPARPGRADPARGADRARRRLGARATGGARTRGDPHLGHHRHAEGRRAQAAAIRSSRGRAALEDPAAGPRDDGDRRADVPLVGLRPLPARRCRWARRSCCAGSSTPRRRCARSPSTGRRRSRWSR